MSDEKLGSPIEISAITEPVLDSIGSIAVVGNEMLVAASADEYTAFATSAAARDMLGSNGIGGIRTYLGLRPGTDIQTYDASLSSLSSLATGSNKIIYTTDVDTYAEADLSAYMRGILNSSNAAALATTANLISSPGVSLDNSLVRWDGIGGSNLQSSNIIIDDSDNVTGMTSLNGITSNTLSQLSNINGNNISGTQWGYVGNFNQPLSSTDDATFNSLSLATTLTVSGASSLGIINMNSNKITNLGNPTFNSDAANKSYVDALAGSGLQSLEACRLSSTTNVAYVYDNTGGDNSFGILTAPANGVGSIDGTTLVVDDRILIKDQSTLLQNGIYRVQDIGSAGTPYVLERAADFEPAVDPITGGKFTIITEGTINAANGFLLRSDVTTIGTNDVIWDQYTVQLTAGAGLSQFGGSYNVNTIGTTGNIYVNGLDQIDINGSLAISKGGTNATSYTAGRILAFNSGGTAFESTSIDPDLVVETTSTQTLTNKTLDSITNDITANALSDAVGAKIDINNVPNTLGWVLKVSSLVPLQAEWGASSQVTDVDGLTAETTADNADTIIIYDDSASANRKMTRANFLAGVTASLPTGITIVSAANGDYTTITSAINAVSAGSTILVYPGTYAENITFDKNIRIIGYPAAQNVVITGGDTTSNRVTFTINATSATLRECTVYTPSSGTNYAINCNATPTGSLIVLYGIALVGAGAGNGILSSSNANANIASLGGLYHNGGTMGVFINMQNGNFTIETGVAAVGSCTDFFYQTGGLLDIQNYRFFNSSLYSCTDIFDISGGEIRVNSFIIPESSPAINALHITGDGVNVSMLGVHLRATSFEVLVKSDLVGTNSVISVSGELTHEKTSFPIGYRRVAKFILLYSDRGINDDIGIKIDGALTVGSPDNPQEAVFGGGDSTTVDMTIYTSTDVTDIAGATYVDVTDEAKSVSGSTFQLFSATTNGVGCFLGNDNRKFYGVKADVTTAITYGSGIITWWYYNGTIWKETQIMATKSSYPYTGNDKTPFTAVSGEQIRFDAAAMDVDWAKTTVNGLNAYWVYCRIGRDIADSDFPNILPSNQLAIGSSPQIERFKLHTNRTEINEDGVIEFFGLSQPIKPIIVSEKLEASNTPSNAVDFDISTNIDGLDITNARLDGTNDAQGHIFSIVNEIDTSRRLNVIVTWVPRSDNTGNVQLQCILASPIRVGTDVDNNSVTETILSNTTAVSNNNGIVFQDTFEFIISSSQVDDLCVIAVKRGASTTFSSNIDILDINIRAYRWRL